MVSKKRDNDLDVLVKAMSQENLTEIEPRLQEKIQRIEEINRLYFSKEFKFRSDNQLAMQMAKKHPISLSTARAEIRVFKQLYVLGNPIDMKFERALLYHSIKENMNKCRETNDRKTLQREHTNMINLLGPEVPDSEARAVYINVINYNPTLIGAVEIPDLEAKVAAMIEKDKQADKEVWDDFSIEPNE